MKIEFLTQDDSNYILPFFDEFFRHYGAEFEVMQVSCCRAMGKRPRAQLARELLGLYGVRGLMRLVARSFLGRVTDVVSGSHTDHAYSIAQVCRSRGIACRSIGNPNAPEFLEQIRQRSPDLVISVACPYILKAPILELPPKGCINIHNARLPKYKGMMPVFWQMYHGERKIGMTVHYMSARIDEGAALLQDALEVLPGEPLDALMRRAKRHGAHCMARVLRQVRDNTQQVIEIKHQDGSYFTFPTPDEVKQFKRRGLRAI